MGELNQVFAFKYCRTKDDLKVIVEEINKCGGNCSCVTLNKKEEIGFFTVTARDEVEFMMEFRRTTAFEFLI